MKLALLGVDDPMLEVVRAIVESDRHTLVSYCSDAPVGAGPAEDPIGVLAPHARRLDDWETLLAANQLDAVLVARCEDASVRMLQLRGLVQQGIPLLLSYPLGLPMLDYYEIDMIQQETGSVLVPYCPLRWHPATQILARFCRLAENRPALSADGEAALAGLDTSSIDDSSIGAVEQIVMERFLEDRSKVAVLAQFTVDAALVSELTGEFARVGAMGSGDEDSAYNNLGVQMVGVLPALGRWSVGPGEGGNGCRLSLLGAGGKAVLNLGGADDPWDLEVVSDGQGRAIRGERWHPGRCALDRFEHAIAGNRPSPTWREAAQLLELSDAVERSLKKGRMVELHQEAYSEKATFKGMMTSLGCGLILFGMLALVAIGMADFLPAWIQQPIADGWPKVLLACFGGFLLLQLLLLVFRQPASKAAEEATIVAEDRH